MKIDIDKLKDLMFDHLLTQSALAEQAKVSSSTISSILNGRQNIGIRIIRVLVEVFGKDAVKDLIIRQD